MTALPLGPDGQLPRRARASMGGHYSALQAWRLRGTGSGKVVYVKGVAHFDEQLRGLQGEVPFVTMELMRGGLLLWLNVTQRRACVGIALEQLEDVHLERQLHTIYYHDHHTAEERPFVYHHGILYLSGPGFEVVSVVTMQEHADIVSFFGKAPLSGRFSVTDVPAEAQHDYAEELVAVIRLIEAIT